jgi:hypothetical protein
VQNKCKIPILIRLGIINISFLTLLIISNIYYAILKNAAINEYILYIAPLIILWLMAVIFSFMKSWNAFGILYLITSLFWTFLGNSNDVGSIIFIFLTIQCFNKVSLPHKKTIYAIVFTVFFLMIFLKFAVFNIFKTDIIIASFFYISVFGINYLINKNED